MIEIEGYTEAVAEERRDRAVAFLNQPEAICGVPVVQMTPEHWEWFRATDNPFVCGGVPEPAHALHALWMISQAFSTKAADRDAFRKKHAGINEPALYAGIVDYIDRMFLDAPNGRDGVPYYSAAASVVYAMAEKPFGWDMARTMKTPLPIIFQLIKARDKASGEPVVNRRSDKVRGDWLARRNAELAKLRKKEERRAARMRKNQPPATDDGR